MQIIGHRGAAGLATENTLESFKKAVDIGVDYIEFDVRKTKDDQLVVSHDNSLKRVFDVDMHISQHTLAELIDNCPELPTLTQAIQACGSVIMIIELKEVIDPKLLKSDLKNVDAHKYRFASFLPQVLAKLRPEFPKTEMSLLSYRHFCGRTNKATEIGATGIGMHYLLLNHFAVWQARKRGLSVYVYTINSPLIAKLYARIFPDLTVCTNNPDKLQSLRSK